MTTLDFLTQTLTDWSANRPRAQQTQTGASQLAGCRAEAVLRLTGTPHSDPRLSWAAEVGSAIHDRVENALTGNNNILIERKFTYRGVPATVDLLFTAERKLVDLKTKPNGAAIAIVRQFGPNEQNRAQVHVGAAAAIEAGFPVDTVELVYIPRDGNLEEGWVFSEPFDRALADKACEWAAEVEVLAADRASLPVGERPEGLRDKPPSWCYSYCPFATVCRGSRPEVVEVDEGVRDVAAEYLQACADEAVAQERKRAARGFLESFTDLRGVGLTWAGGGSRKVEEVDVEQLRALWEFTHGELPTRVVEKTSPRSLRRVR